MNQVLPPKVNVLKKTSEEPDEKAQLTDYKNLAFMGSSVIYGSATAVAVTTGDKTLFRTMAKKHQRRKCGNKFFKRREFCQVGVIQ